MRKADLPTRTDTALAITDDDALRCCCGNLLARLIPDGVELKCRRCKRCVIVPFDTNGSAGIDM